MINKFDRNTFLVAHGYGQADSCRLKKFTKVSNILSVIPGINIITGLFKLFIASAIAHKADKHGNDKDFAAGLAFRGVTEILFGPLLLISDIAITCLRSKKNDEIIKKLNLRYNN